MALTAIFANNITPNYLMNSLPYPFTYYLQVPEGLGPYVLHYDLFQTLLVLPFILLSVYYIGAPPP